MAAAVSIALLASFSSIPGLFFLLLASLTSSTRHLLASRPGLAWVMAAWLVWLPISTTWALSAGMALFLSSLLLCLPLAWLVGRTMHEQGRLKPFLQTLLPVALVVLVAWGMWQGPNTFTGKPQGPFNDPNTYLCVLDLLLLPVLARYLATDLASSPPLWRTAMLGLLGAYVLVFFLVASRGAGLAVLAVLPILLWKAKDSVQYTRKIGLLTAVLLAAFLAASAINTAGPALTTRLSALATEGDGPRWHLVTAAWSMIQDHPWLGTGLGSFQYLYPQYRNPLERFSAGGWVHNDYLQLWLEGGVFLLLLPLCLLAWTGWHTLKELRNRTPDSLEQTGYLIAAFATLLHASVNFVIYFSAIAALLGLYLANLTPVTISRPPARPWRLLAGGYALIMGTLMFGMVVVESVLGHMQPIQSVMWKLGKTYSRFDAALALSFISPFNHGPRMALADELSEIWLASGRTDTTMLLGALAELEDSLRLLPCDPAASSQALFLLSQAQNLSDQTIRAQSHSDMALSCDARSGITYYYIGLIMEKQAPVLALEYWRAGMAASIRRGEKLLLAAMILSREMPEQKAQFEQIAGKVLKVWHALLRNQPTGVAPSFGDEIHEHLRILGGEQFEALL